MRHLLVFLILLCSQLVSAQISKDADTLVFVQDDLKILQRADELLTDSSKWNRKDDRVCDDDIAAGKYSLFCALYKASVDITGKYIHRRAAMQIARFVLEQYENGRVKEHRLMDWNNHPSTTFEEVKKILRESIEAIQKKLKQH